MADTQAIADYLEKAAESLNGAESERANRRFNNCANRCYYACFQAAIAALIAADIQSLSRSGRWRHEYVQAQFAGELINRRQRYPPTLRRTLSDIMLLRLAADYGTTTVSEIEAFRALQLCRKFVAEIRFKEGGTS